MAIANGVAPRLVGDRVRRAAGVTAAARTATPADPRCRGRAHSPARPPGSRRGQDRGDGAARLGRPPPPPSPARRRPLIRPWAPPPESSSTMRRRPCHRQIARANLDARPMACAITTTSWPSDGRPSRMALRRRRSSSEIKFGAFAARGHASRRCVSTGRQHDQQTISRRPPGRGGWPCDPARPPQQPHPHSSARAACVPGAPPFPCRAGLVLPRLRSAPCPPAVLA